MWKSVCEKHFYSIGSKTINEVISVMKMVFAFRFKHKISKNAKQIRANLDITLLSVGLG